MIDPLEGTAPSDSAGELAQRLLALWPDQTEDHALLFLDPSAIVVGANPVVERLLGYSRNELVGQPLSRIFAAEDLALGIDRHEVEVARRTGRSEDDRWHLRKDGSRFWALGLLSAINDRGACIGFVKALRDRTDLRAQISAFENRLAVSRQALSAKEAFMSIFAHELRNPLSGLSNALAVLKRQQSSAPESTWALDLAARQMKVLTRLIDDLHDASRLDHGALKLELSAVDLQAALRSAVQTHADVSQSRGQTVSILLPPGAIHVRADPVRLEQILRNLLDNAFKYTPRGGRVWVTATVEVPMAVIRVRDDGEGMSPETMPRIFEMFTRDARAIESATEGLGVGLAVVKNLVQLHGGTIEVHSAGVGYGSEFTVNLPLWAA